jgi:adenylate cyclase class 2
MKTTLEIEVKLAGSNLERLYGAGFELKQVRPRHFEDNWLLDSPDRRLLGEGAALRVRSTGRGGLVTYKGVVHENTGSMLKVREEIESEVDEPERIVELFERLGFHRTFRYQKFRTVYGLVIDGHELEVAFDETPIGKFLEIEGDGQTVLQALKAAGLSEGDIIRESYPELQASRCKQRGVPLEDLVFED